MTETAPRRRPSPVVAQVLSTQRLTPGLVRIVVGGPGLAPLTARDDADSYVKLMFLPAGERPLLPDGRLDLEAVRATLPEGEAPRLRAYTVREYGEGTITLDLVVHGDEGLAGPWAATAQPGDEVLIMGPGGAWSPSDDVEHHLLLGDASALPAIAVALERLRDDARGTAVIEVHDAHDQLDLAAPAGVDVRWVHTGDGVPGAALVETALSLELPDGRIGAFVHGEAGAVRRLRRWLRLERGLTREDLSASGYWRLGVDDEGWREGKRAWNEAVEADEQAAVV